MPAKKPARGRWIHNPKFPDGKRLVIASDDITARVREMPQHYGKIAGKTVAEQVKVACEMARETGMTRFSGADLDEPILKGNPGRHAPCDRQGVRTLAYYGRTARDLWRQFTGWIGL